jgi:ubiquinone/menaquinone biosynthesis C-methylase UbiE
MNEIKRKIKEYWEHSPPMGFIDKPLSYEEKRRFRYSLQDYMHEVFGFTEFARKLVLDLGCGAGIDSAEFARNGARVISVDFTHTATKLTRSLLREANLPSQVVQADATALPFRTNTFDCVYSFGVLHHIPNVENALAEMKRVLKPGGQVMAMVYHKDSLLYAYSIVYLRGIKEGWLDRLSLDEILSKYSERREGNPYARAYSKFEAKELFERFFDNVQVEVRYNVIDLPNERKMKVNLPDKYELGWHLIVKGIKGKRRKRL